MIAKKCGIQLILVINEYLIFKTYYAGQFMPLPGLTFLQQTFVYHFCKFKISNHISVHFKGSASTF